MSGGEPTLWDSVLAKSIHSETTGGPVGRGHPDTSKRAAARVRSGSQRYRVLEALNASGAQTAYELADRVRRSDGSYIAPNQIATRLGELRDLGLVARSRTFDGGPFLERATTPGNHGIVHQITLAGTHAYLAERKRAAT